jgi:hypothetical protein
MQKFCHNCGKQIATVGAKFCAHCGTDLASLSSAPRPPAKATTFTPFAADADEDDEYIDRLERLDIRINKLDVDIVKDRQVSETLGTLAQGIPATEEMKRKEHYQGVNEKDFLEQFKKEAGSLRPKS